MKEFQFPDAEIETRAVIEQFLFLTTYGALNRSIVTLGRSGEETTVLTVLTNLLHFLHKYDCESTLEVFRGAISRGQLWGWEAFSIGVLAHDDDLCAASLTIPAALYHDSRTVRHLGWSDLPDDVRRWAGLRYQYALERFRLHAAQWSEVLPMPVEAPFLAALAEFDNLKEHPAFRHGDAIPIFSDKWMFRCPTYMLQNAGFPTSSKVNDSALGEQASQFLIFNDNEKENADVLEQFRNLVVHGKLLPPHGREGQSRGIPGVQVHETCRHTLALLQKRHCIRVIERFGEEVIKLMECGVLEPRFGFGLGLLAGDKRVCAASVTFYDPKFGRFEIHAAIAVLLRWNAYKRDHPLLLALEHSQTGQDSRSNATCPGEWS